MRLFIDDKMDHYAHEHTRPEPEYLRDLETHTRATMAFPEMLTGRQEGRFLKMLVQLVQPMLVVELGTYTGYSALSMAEGLPSGGRILTCESDEKAQKFAQDAFDRSPVGGRITLCKGPALDTVLGLQQPIDLAFIDADKTGYARYYEEIVSRTRSGGVIVLDNMFLSGEVLTRSGRSAEALDDLNRVIVADERTENVFLTLRDGVQLVRKK